ncbi:ATP-dependent DNA/RNA helicase [Geotalea daltonii FRC-32]|uniref:ATP-dependent DNA/RNA helicase n=1 Tax=Geotalea daltonii (strain DSM 22248 / JCM 15807 / FRC-32) TaxID=316067 RepID=B9M244_GEODF|nr:DEAD/DEAH box helicase [Geotalea daltonii]ACM21162.1 ATP-dependent DNA/RNA helicase [Geotalea daltonii FRC-32]
MQSAEKKTMTSLGKEERFRDVFAQLTVGESLKPGDRAYILAAAMLFIRRYQQDRRYTSYADLAYYIILKYSLQYADYAPLYDFAVNFGFYPIAKAILTNGLYDSNLIITCLGDIKLDRFRNESDDILTLEQFIASSSFLNENAQESCYLAPTSFGKSSLIVDQIKRLGTIPSRIVILVPTKSLLIQTFQMIRKANLQRKLIIHDEMYDGEDSFIAVFTQERALRLLAKHNTCFDIVFVDEAHNLLKGNSRSILLSRVIAKNRVLNPSSRVIYLSPLLNDANSLRLAPDQNISSHVIRFNVKEPEIYELRLNKEVHQYNRFLGSTYKLREGVEIKDYVLANSGEKNFLYNYRPVKVERLAGELCEMVPQIEPTDKVSELARILTNEVHPDFYAIEHLKHGVVYLHGKLPDLVKEYLEFKYKDLPELKYVVANSVILEGMNFPIDTLFIFNTYSLRGKELMNLIGRVNRLNTIFGQKGNRLERLLPKVHFVNNEEHNSAKSKMENKIALLRSRVFDDEIKNPMLEAFDIEALSMPVESKEKYLEKVTMVQENERFLTDTPQTMDDEIKAYLIQSGIIEFYSDPDEVVRRIIAESPTLASCPPEWWTAAPMMEKIEYLFLREIDSISDAEIKRLSHAETRNYYESHILIAQKKALNENINSQIQYFKQKVNSNNSKMYFGKSYGEEPYETASYLSPSNNTYVDLAIKNDRQLVNLAVVKLKMEDDFVSFKINKFIVMLFDYHLISTDEYNLYIYGTNDEKKIRLTKYGLSVGMVSRLEEDGQLNNLEFDEFNNLRATPALDEFLQTVNDFYRFEIRRFIG